jgi:hypothetical protein
MTFAFNYKKQADIQQLDLGVYWYNYPLVLGLWYRGIPYVNSQRGDAMVFLVGIKTRQFNVGYSYDFTISNLLGAVRGSHEISLTYKFLLPKRTTKEVSLARSFSGWRLAIAGGGLRSPSACTLVVTTLVQSLLKVMAIGGWRFGKKSLTNNH